MDEGVSYGPPIATRPMTNGTWMDEFYRDCIVCDNLTSRPDNPKVCAKCGHTMLLMVHHRPLEPAWSIR